MDAWRDSQTTHEHVIEARWSLITRPVLTRAARIPEQEGTVPTATHYYHHSVAVPSIDWCRVFRAAGRCRLASHMGRVR